MKIWALIAFVLISLYTPSTTNRLLDVANDGAKFLAQGTEYVLEHIGITFGTLSALAPKKGTVELAFRLIAMEKVILFIGIIIVLYLVWMALVLMVRSVTRSTQTPRNPAEARLQTEPPR
ncbi:MAG: hypothetical protein KIT16_08405 [Rhodospirillaceae bacterium]|nr:hypothetical protein [Rhodospirillaceae bacterium]